jgi:DNA-binding protein HU-beta
MTKAELVASIAKKTGKTVVEVSQMVEAYHDTVKENINTGVTIRGFGTFLLKKRAEKIARNILAGTNIIVPEHLVPMLKFAKEFKETVK